MNILEIIKEEVNNYLQEKVIEPTQKIEKIITHGGMFHADELLAISIMKIFENPQVQVERKNEITKEEFNDPSIMILDVGKTYYPQKNVLDHHQDSSLGASCNLVLDWLEQVRGKTIGNTNLRNFSNNVSNIDVGIIGGGGPLDFFNSRIKHFNQIPDGINYAYKLSDIATRNVMSGKNWDDGPKAQQLIKLAEDEKNRQFEESIKLWNDPHVFHKEDKYAYKIDPNDKRFVKWQDIESKKANPIVYVMTGRARDGGYGVNSIDPKKYPILPDKSQSFLHANKFFAVYRTQEDAIRHMEEMTKNL